MLELPKLVRPHSKYCTQLWLLNSRKHIIKLKGYRKDSQGCYGIRELDLKAWIGCDCFP